MKNKMQILGRISLGLLICIILGQGIWLYRVREMENHGLADGRPGPERYLVGGGDFPDRVYRLFSLAKGCGEKD